MAPKGALCGLWLLPLHCVAGIFFSPSLYTTEVIKAGLVSEEAAIVASTRMLVYM